MFGTKGIATFKTTHATHTGIKVNPSHGGTTTFDYLNVSVYGVK